MGRKITHCDNCGKKFKDKVELWYTKSWWDIRHLIPEFLCEKCSKEEYEENMKN